MRLFPLPLVLALALTNSPASEAVKKLISAEAALPPALRKGFAFPDAGPELLALRRTGKPASFPARRQIAHVFEFLFLRPSRKGGAFPQGRRQSR
jgi:hypothetical protein